MTIKKIATLATVTGLLSGCTVWTSTQAKNACMEKLNKLETKPRQRIIVDEAKATNKAETWGKFMNEVSMAGQEVVFRRFVNKARSQASQILGPRQKSIPVARMVYVRYMLQRQEETAGPWVDKAYKVATCVAVWDEKKERTLTSVKRHLYSDR